MNTILDQVELKRKGKLDKVYVTGCLSERYKNNLEEEIPEVDAFFWYNGIAGHAETI
ncbi:MAG: hypothetical protein WDM90_14165 [Ferruginibacter sp.]